MRTYAQKALPHFFWILSKTGSGKHSKATFGFQGYICGHLDSKALIFFIVCILG
uniref:Uncharacterized protein n=1 Tax=Arundo donax TaxID=35708 RepID=A0A0A9HXB8_ARUDO